jgi:hypothetical protein
MYVNEWMSSECSDEGTCTQNIHNSPTHSHASEEEIALGIAAKITSVNGPYERNENSLFCNLSSDVFQVVLQMSRAHFLVTCNGFVYVWLSTIPFFMQTFHRGRFVSCNQDVRCPVLMFSGFYQL